MPTDDASVTSDVLEPRDASAGPIDVKEPSRTARALTSWKLWILLFLLGLLGIGISLTMPMVYRLRAMRYFDRLNQSARYQLSDEHADWTERYGT